MKKHYEDDVVCIYHYIEVFLGEMSEETLQKEEEEVVFIYLSLTSFR